MIYKCNDCNTEIAEIKQLPKGFNKTYEVTFWHTKINGYCWPWKTYIKIKPKKVKQ